METDKKTVNEPVDNSMRSLEEAVAAVPDFSIFLPKEETEDAETET